MQKDHFLCPKSYVNCFKLNFVRKSSDMVSQHDENKIAHISPSTTDVYEQWMKRGRSCLRTRNIQGVAL